MTDQAQLEVVKIVLTSVLVVAGWIVVNYLQRTSIAEQEARKEIRAGLNLLRDDIRQLRQSCIAYFVAGDEAPDTPVGIRVLFEDVRRQSVSLSRVLVDDAGRERTLNALTQLGQHATGGTFETRNRKKLSPYDPQLHAVFNHGANLLTNLEDGYEKKYPRA